MGNSDSQPECEDVRNNRGAGGGNNRRPQGSSQQAKQKKTATVAPLKKYVPPKKDSTATVKANTKANTDITAKDISMMNALADVETKGSTFEKIEILEDSHHNFESLFSRYMDRKLTSIRIVEPYLMNKSQFHILFHFIECCVLHCQQLQLIQVITKRGTNPAEQEANFADIRKSLVPWNIKFAYELDTKEHDRSIVFSNGYVFRVGRGMDFFQKIGNQRFFIGMHDQRLLACKKTTIYIDKF